MSYLLFLDDERVPTGVSWVRLPAGAWVLVRNYEQFVRKIEADGLPRFVSFDHDLCTARSGYDCARWLVEYCLDNEEPLPEYEIHSTNPVGARNIGELLRNARPHLAGFAHAT